MLCGGACRYVRAQRSSGFSGSVCFLLFSGCVRPARVHGAVGEATGWAWPLFRDSTAPLKVNMHASAVLLPRTLLLLYTSHTLGARTGVSIVRGRHTRLKHVQLPGPPLRCSSLSCRSPPLMLIGRRDIHFISCSRATKSAKFSKVWPGPPHGSRPLFSDVTKRGGQRDRLGFPLFTDPFPTPIPRPFPCPSRANRHCLPPC